MDVAESGAQALDRCATNHLDIVILDMGMPGLEGLTAAALIRRQFPNVHIVVLTQYDDEYSLAAAMRAGARGFLGRRAGREELLTAIRTVASGTCYYYCEPVSAALQAAQRQLSGRELDLLHLIANGKSTKEAATAFDISAETAKGYRKTLMGKLGAHNVAELLKRAAALGLLADQQQKVA